MGLEYLKITPEIMLKISAYDEDAQGRLILAMIEYALKGTEPDFEGMEKFIWPTLKMDIDRCAASVEKQTANGSKGGRPSKTHQKYTETQNNPTETQPEPTESLNTNTNTNTNINRKTNNDVVVARARDTIPASSAQEPVIGIDGTDLSESIRLNAEVDTLLRTYRLSEALRGDLLDDIAAHGLDKVKRVMHDAAQSDTKGGLSIKFIRACLANDGKPKPAARLSAAGRSERDHMQRHNYTKQDYDAMMMDLDA